MSMTQFQLPNLIQHMREGMMLASMAFVAMEVGPLLASTADGSHRAHAISPGLVCVAVGRRGGDRATERACL